MATGNKVIEQNVEGKLIINGNELKIVSLIVEGDAAFMKVISPVVDGESGGGGGFSIDAGDEGRNVPLVELLGAMFQGGAEMKLVLLKKGVGMDPDDEDYQTIMEATSNGVEFKVPISAPNLNGGTGNQQRLFSADGRLMWQLQNDGGWAPLGAIIVYDSQVPGRVGQWTAVGKLVPQPL